MRDATDGDARDLGATPADPFPMLEEPFYGWTRDGKTPYRPTAREVLRDVRDGIDISRGISRLVPFLWVVFYVATAGAAVAYVIRGPRPATIAFIAAAIAYISTIYNTVWFHRYCSHKAFRFARPAARLFFLWTNPIFFREESYALPHHVHHARSDAAGDPYGPHLGWLGTMASFETEQRTNTAIPEWRYKTLVKLLSHVGIPINGYAEFQRTQSVEPIAHFVLRASVAQALYALAAYALGGADLVITWYAAVFVFLTLLRDFNWHGHGGSRAKEPAENRPGPSYARNQAFYGLLAGEWHGNHHLYPRSARAGVGPWQPDVAFAVIRMLHRAGVVASYHEDLPGEAAASAALSSSDPP